MVAQEQMRENEGREGERERERYGGQFLYNVYSGDV